MELSAQVIKRLIKELHELVESPSEGIRVIVNEANIADIVADIDGPEGTPYEGGTFRMRLTLPTDFPASPPKGFFITKIFHPNASASCDPPTAHTACTLYP